MSNEIVVFNDPNEKKEKRTWTLNPIALIKALLARNNESAVPTELLLSNEQIHERVTALYELIEREGEKVLQLGKDRYCRIYINPRSNSRNLEFRIGTQKQISAERFDGIVDIELIVQAQVIKGQNQIFHAVKGNLARQAEMLIGPGEYTYLGTLNGLEYFRNVGAVAVPTTEGFMKLSVPDQVKQTILQQIFQPLSGIIWKLTENIPSRRPAEPTPHFIIEGRTNE